MLLDLKAAVRGLRARPLFTVVALATLAVGIAANAAIFAFIDAVLLRPLPYPHSERLVALYTRYLPATGYDFPFFPLSGPELSDLQTRIEAFSSVAAYQLAFRNVSSGTADAERLLTMSVTPGFSDVVAIAPALGRALTEEDGRRQCAAVLRHDLWQRLGADRIDALRLRVDDVPCDVVGVMPPGFAFRDDRIQMWTALVTDISEAPGNRGSHGLFAVARLQDAATVQQAEAQLQALRSYWSERFPDHYAKGHFAVLRGLRDDLVGDQRATLLLMGGAVGFVMLIICANVAGLLVSRSEGRRRELAIRRALGAKRATLVRQVFSEAAVLAAAGGALGLVLANWVLAGMLALYPERLPTGDTITIDYRTVVFAFATVAVSAILVGVLPALHATGLRLLETLKADGRAISSRTAGSTSRSLLVAGQIALSVTLVISALLLIRTYVNLQAVDLGFSSRGLLTFFVSVPPGREPDPAAARRLLQRIETQLAALPGVGSVGAMSALPLLSAGPADDFTIDGRPDPAPGTPAWNARYLLATPMTVQTLGVPLLSGRLFQNGDVDGQPLVALVNETAARLYWRGENPVGTMIRYWPRETSPAIRIVGIVGDVRSLGAGEPPPPAIYVPYDQSPRPGYEGRGMWFVIRVEGVPEALTPSVRAAVASIAPGLPLANLRDMDSIAAENLGQPRFTNLAMSCLAGLAVFLAAIGLYGVLAYNVETRTREIGIRIALGASRGEILGSVVRRGLALSAAGFIIGVPAAIALTRLLGSLLFGVTGADALTYAGVISILGAATLLASYLPARRAVRVDPVVALKAE